MYYVLLVHFYIYFLCIFLQSFLPCWIFFSFICFSSFIYHILQVVSLLLTFFKVPVSIVILLTSFSYSFHIPCTFLLITTCVCVVVCRSYLPFYLFPRLRSHGSIHSPSLVLSGSSCPPAERRRHAGVGGGDGLQARRSCCLDY